MYEQVEVTTSGCWRWTGLVGPDGYARVSHLGQRSRAGHRIAWEAFNGAIPAGMVLHHVCHEDDRRCPGGPSCLHRRCVRPAHLEQMTPAQHAARSNRSGQAMKKAS